MRSLEVGPLLWVLVIVAALVAAAAAPAQTASERSPLERPGGTIAAIIGRYTIDPVDASFNPWGSPGWYRGLSTVEGDRLLLTAKSADDAGPDPAYCVIISTVFRMNGTNGDVMWESIGCEPDRNVAYVQDQFGEWYSGAFAGGRATILGPGYSWPLTGDGTPFTMDISGVVIATMGIANATYSQIVRGPIDYTGEIEWRHFEAIPWERR